MAKITEVFAGNTKETPLHLAPKAPGKRKTFAGSRMDFNAAVAADGTLRRVSGSPEPKIYWLNAKKQVVACWDNLDKTGYVISAAA